MKSAYLVCALHVCWGLVEVQGTAAVVLLGVGGAAVVVLLEVGASDEKVV